MKATKLLYFALTPILLLSVTGCYTQLAPRVYQDRDYSYENQEEYTENADDTSYYGDEEYEYSDSAYTDSETVIENNYYIGGYPTYRRYYWGYYPSVSVGIYWGSSYYDPFCWDPFYWSTWYPGWCSPFYYSPVYVSYYPWYYYYPGYYYSHWDNYNGHYRERDRDGYSIRNNDGLRNSFVSRGNLTRDNNHGTNDRSLERSGRDNIARDRDRTALNERDRTLKNRESLERNRTGSRDVLTTKRNKSDDKRISVGRDDRIKRESMDKERKVTPPRVFDRTKTERKTVDRNKQRQGNTKDGQRINTPGQRKNTDIKRDTRQKTNPPNNVGTNRNNNPPRQTYSPPRQNSNPPRTTTPPRNSSGGSQNNGSGNRRR